MSFAVSLIFRSLRPLSARRFQSTTSTELTLKSTPSQSPEELSWEDELRKLDHTESSVLDPGGPEDETAPYIRPTFNLAAYVNKSETLQQLVKLGVDLNSIEKRPGISQFILKLDFDQDIKDHLIFLNDIGVSPDVFGAFITKNPLIFKEDLANLETRVNYLESKRFQEQEIIQIVQKNPFWLMFSTQRIDKRLGFFQKEFRLHGKEVRSITVRQPRLITYNMMHLRKSTFSIKEEMGFEDDETKQLLLARPKLWMKNHDKLIELFDYLNKTIALTHEQILKTPDILNCRLFRIKQRHEFLVSLNKAQYDPKKELYVPLQALYEGDDQHFVHNVARATIREYQDFLKTL